MLTIEGAGVRPTKTRTFLQLWSKASIWPAGLARLGLQPGRQARHAAGQPCGIRRADGRRLAGGSDAGTDRSAHHGRQTGLHARLRSAARRVVAGDYALAEVSAVRAQIDRPAVAHRPAHRRGQGHCRATARYRCHSLCRTCRAGPGAARAAARMQPRQCAGADLHLRHHR